MCLCVEMMIANMRSNNMLEDEENNVTKQLMCTANRNKTKYFFHFKKSFHRIHNTHHTRTRSTSVTLSVHPFDFAHGIAHVHDYDHC